MLGGSWRSLSGWVTGGIGVIVGIIVIIRPRECWIAGCGGRRRVRVGSGGGVVISGGIEERVVSIVVRIVVSTFFVIDSD